MKSKLLIGIGTLAAVGVPLSVVGCAYSPTFNKTVLPEKYSDIFFIKKSFGHNIDMEKYPVSVQLDYWNPRSDLSHNPIHDGDSLWIKPPSLIGNNLLEFPQNLDSKAKKIDISKSIELRLWGVDTPEISSPTNGNWLPTSGIENKWGNKATDFVRKILNEEKYPIYIYPVAWEKFGRLVADIKYLPEKNQEVYNSLSSPSDDEVLSLMDDLSLRLVREGLARAAYLTNKYTTHLNHKNEDLIKNIYKTQDDAMGVAQNSSFMNFTGNALTAKPTGQTPKGIWTTPVSDWNTIFPKAMGKFPTKWAGW